VILLAASTFVVLVLGARLARLGASDEAGATALVRTGLWTCAVLVLIEEALGAAGVLGPYTIAAVVIAAGVVVEVATRRHRPPPAPRPRDPWTAFELGLAAALVAAVASRLWFGLHRTTYLYDTLSYHLHAPATWLHDERLSIVNAVFGDPAPAYAPSNVELGFLFLMAPLHSDFFAQAGQLPLAALAVAAVAAAVREGAAEGGGGGRVAGRSRSPLGGEAGGGRAAALASALAFLLVPEVWQQAPTAMADVGTTAFLLAALPFLQRLAREARAADAAALGLAVGLAAGSKVVGLVYAAPVLAAAAVTLARTGQLRPSVARDTLLAAIAAGGFWYVRNLVVAGNPLYPATLKLGGATLFRGLYDGALLRTSQYHVPITDLGALGGLLLEPGVGFAAGGALALALARSRLWALLAGAFVLCFWLVVPHQESRFLFPLWGVAAVALGAPSRARHALLAWAPLALALTGSLVQFPTAERWAVVGVGVAAGLAGTVLAPRIGGLFARRAAVALVIAAACVLGLEGRRTEARGHAYSVGDDLDAPWAWVRANVRGRRVAYTGNNLPFPLWGVGLANDVTYVNVSGAPGDLAHDCARRSHLVASTPEPAPCRESGGYDTWRHNLRATGRQILFVAALYPGVRDPIAFDGDAFPVERDWADAHPADFTLRFANAAARVYEVAP
jgi:hypothetical protein